MYVKVKVTPDAKREAIFKENNTLFRINVREPAERNLANRRVREMLASHFGLKPGAVRLTAGHRSESKIFDVLLDKT